MTGHVRGVLHGTGREQARGATGCAGVEPGTVYAIVTFTPSPGCVVGGLWRAQRHYNVSWKSQNRTTSVSAATQCGVRMGPPVQYRPDPTSSGIQGLQPLACIAPPAYTLMGIAPASPQAVEHRCLRAHMRAARSLHELKRAAPVLSSRKSPGRRGPERGHMGTLAGDLLHVPHTPDTSNTCTRPHLRLDRFRAKYQVAHAASSKKHELPDLYYPVPAYGASICRPTALCSLYPAHQPTDLAAQAGGVAHGMAAWKMPMGVQGHALATPIRWRVVWGLMRRGGAVRGRLSGMMQARCPWEGGTLGSEGARAAVARCGHDSSAPWIPGWGEAQVGRASSTRGSSGLGRHGGCLGAACATPRGPGGLRLWCGRSLTGRTSGWGEATRSRGGRGTLQFCMGVVVDRGRRRRVRVDACNGLRSAHPALPTTDGRGVDAAGPASGVTCERWEVVWDMHRVDVHLLRLATLAPQPCMGDLGDIDMGAVTYDAEGEGAPVKWAISIVQQERLMQMSGDEDKDVRNDHHHWSWRPTGMDTDEANCLMKVHQLSIQRIINSPNSALPGDAFPFTNRKAVTSPATLTMCTDTEIVAPDKGMAGKINVPCMVALGVLENLLGCLRTQRGVREGAGGW
ncbi:hypothetical protein JB92DRAFT_2827321 [Gautieria morchelliformis]|nr:hypothetical protein JB92DRAFT_2827321 [Gautieria morchelliformis]